MACNRQLASDSIKFLGCTNCAAVGLHGGCFSNRSETLFCKNISAQGSCRLGIGRSEDKHLDDGNTLEVYRKVLKESENLKFRKGWWINVVNVTAYSADQHSYRVFIAPKGEGSSIGISS